MGIGGKIWTISNALSMARIVLVVPIAFLLLRASPGHNFIAALLVIAAGLTDLFDGILARHLNQVTEFGKIIDPLADKIGIASIAVILTLQAKLPFWFLLLVLARDVSIFIGGLYVKRAYGIVLMSNWAGKWASACMAFLLLIAVLDVPFLISAKYFFLEASAAMLVISSVLYARRLRSMITRKNTYIV